MAQPKFRYRLEKILELKRKKEDDEKEQLAKLLAEEDKERQLKLKLENQLADVRTELKERQRNGTLDINGLRFFPQHIKHLENLILNQELRLKELAILITEQRHNLMRAAQERKTYEKHKDTSREAWQAELDAEEAKMIDELATLKYAREQAIG
ncbi:MAG: flagellar export protein FliJ [Candidatus Xenobium sp.]|jgi:flagellar export protein FliJ|nr:flagellar export protein FliJ [Burkholderiales bacterium]